MKNEIILLPVKGTPELFRRLEKRGLIFLLRPSAKLRGSRTSTGMVEVLHSSRPENGGHKLAGIAKRSTEIRLSCHTDNEEFILLNPDKIKYRPLFLILGLESRATLESKASKGKLSAEDFLAVELIYNDPATCVFSLRRNVAHCEVTLPGKEMHPIFFVTEPSKIAMNYVRLPGTTFKVATSRLAD